MISAYSPILALLPAVFFVLYLFCLWFATLRFAAGAPIVDRRGIVLLLVPAGLWLLSVLAEAWVGPELRFAVAGEEWTTGWGFAIADALRLIFSAAVVVVFAGLIRSSSTRTPAGPIPAWAVLVTGAAGSVGLVVWLVSELEFAPTITTPALVVICGLILLGVASVLGAGVVHMMRSRSGGSVRPGSHSS